MMTSHELDCEVAEKVMGWRIHEDFYVTGTGVDYGVNALPEFSSDPAAWMLIVRYMREKGFYFSLHSLKDVWTVDFDKTRRFSKNTTTDAVLGRAVCLAALRAMEN